MIWMVLAVPRKAVWMIMTIPAMRRTTAMAPAAFPKSASATGIRVAAPAISIWPIPSAPYMQNAMMKYMKRQSRPQAMSALGTSLEGSLYSAP